MNTETNTITGSQFVKFKGTNLSGAGTPELVAVRERIKEIRQGTDTILGQLCDLHMRLHGHHPIPPQPMQEAVGSKADSSAGEISNLHDELSRALNNMANLRICAEKLA